jgi:membrane-associated phospholipid phosphatase
MQSNSKHVFLRIVVIVLLIVVSLAPSNCALAGTLLYRPSPSQSYQKCPTLDPITYRSVSSLENDGESARGTFILHQLYCDFTYLLAEPDFYGVVGGLGLAPSIFGPAFRNESPELTELWGPSTSADHFFEIGETVGNGAFPVLASVTSWGVGKVAGSSRLSKFGSDLFRAQVINGLLTTVLKGSINRTRPDGAPYSYPSGHTSAAFATAGTVYTHFGKTWGISAFVFAGYVGLSRLQEGKHYLSDVIAGGILGSYVSLKLARRGSKNGPISVSTRKMDTGVGLSLALQF